MYEIGPGTGARSGGLAVLIPDATPGGGPFRPSGAGHVRVLLADGTWSWPVLARFLRFVAASGDIVPSDDSAVTGDLSLTLNHWTFGKRRFEVNSYWPSDPDAWCYELYELGQADGRNDYLEVRVPNVNADPNSGAFMPDDAENVTVTVFGTWTVPWPVLAHFIAAVDATGEIATRAKLP
jgi:hypothetical protein